MSSAAMLAARLIPRVNRIDKPVRGGALSRRFVEK
jgi:hypothetical protein